MLVELPCPAVEDLSGERVALLEVRLGLDLAPVGRLDGQSQDVQGLGDPAVVRDGVAEHGRAAVPRQHADHVVGPHRAGAD